MRACLVVEPLERRRLLATLPAGFFESPVTGPVALGSTLEVAPDGKLFVVEQPGRIQVYANYASQAPSLLQANFFRDAPPAVNVGGERGMFGIAFDPNYASNRFVYVHYTFNGPGFPNRISRFAANAAGDLALPDSETVILEMEPSPQAFHNGGGMRFGPDGKLYVGVGDNVNGANAQSLTTLKGKILRMNVTPGDLVPGDNPSSFDGIAGTTSGIHRLIWAAGLRNPFTLDIQPGTGRVFINDVGNLAWEEINEGAPGRNFGWPATEGDFDPAAFPNFTRPTFAYSHGMGPGPVFGDAIVGAAFYNPAAQMFPADYLGDYFFGDFSNGWIRRIDPATRVVSDFAFGLPFLADLRVAPDGSLLYLTHHGTDGRVLHVEYDVTAPVVSTSEFQFEGVTLPAPPHRLRFTFSEDVSASLTTSDLVLRNTTTNQTVPAGSIALAWDGPTRTATFTFPGFADGILPDGRYTATLPAGSVADRAGNALAADAVRHFFFLLGDATRDARVSLDDFNVLAANFGQANRTFTQGDFTYDGVVNLADFNILAGRFGADVAAFGSSDDDDDDGDHVDALLS